MKLLGSILGFLALAMLLCGVGVFYTDFAGEKESMRVYGLVGLDVCFCCL